MVLSVRTLTNSGSNGFFPRRRFSGPNSFPSASSSAMATGAQRGMLPAQFGDGDIAVHFDRRHDVPVAVPHPDIVRIEPAQFVGWNEHMLLSGRVLDDVAELVGRTDIGREEPPVNIEVEKSHIGADQRKAALVITLSGDTATTMASVCQATSRDIAA
jgi:hypothetical protein